MANRFRNNVWFSFTGNIIACDADAAVFLASFLHYVSSGNEYASALEVIDLQRYKVIKKQPKVRITLRERVNTPFIFVVGKN